ncbi:DNA repair protein RecN [Leucobacter sp. M11]|uniref:DNA repair protein RecN n=1 Tax=Leucobacter sp. M11 TaxID=2993565 RepID=UPI002D80AA49|nr:DNA repair protein RecN [Leucobacter sp. M11]MEB4613813.1 DNA repair protein RecN [Leucobacter sp. M11]
MIDELAIRDLGVIADARLPLGPGFTAITGETGAGKTMVVTALGLLMGQRADAGTVRTGAAQARVTGILHVPEDGAAAALVDDAGGVVEDGELVLSRTVNAEGRSRASVGGSAAPVGVLGKLAEQLFAVHGQSDQLRLKSQAAQREALDRFGGPELAAALAEYRGAFQTRQALAAEHDELTRERTERVREAERLRAELAEIDQVEPVSGELTELSERLDRLGNSEALRQATVTAHEALSSESDDPFQKDVRGLIADAHREIERVRGFDPALVPVLDALDAMRFQADDLAATLASYSGALDAEGPAELERASERLGLLQNLTRKFGPELDDVLGYADSGRVRLEELDGDDERVEELAALREAAEAALAAARERLSALRVAAAAELGERVTRELHALALPDAAFEASVQPLDAPAGHGGDEVQLLLRPHPGSPPRPLGKGASGGELSRVMLAIEVVVAQADPVPTFVFDEVDSGVGGAAAIEIGRRLARLAETSQVIVVTHLAQVAAFANNHLQVVKDSAGGFTESSCTRLDGDARLAEMARLLSGITDSQSALEHAAELLALRDSRD